MTSRTARELAWTGPSSYASWVPPQLNHVVLLELGADFVEFVLQWLLGQIGRELTHVTGNNDTSRIRYSFTPELGFEETESWSERLGVA